MWWLGVTHATSRAAMSWLNSNIALGVLKTTRPMLDPLRAYSISTIRTVVQPGDKPKAARKRRKCEDTDDADNDTPPGHPINLTNCAPCVNGVCSVPFSKLNVDFLAGLMVHSPSGADVTCCIDGHPVPVIPRHTAEDPGPVVSVRVPVPVPAPVPVLRRVTRSATRAQAQSQQASKRTAACPPSATTFVWDRKCEEEFWPVRNGTLDVTCVWGAGKDVPDDPAHGLVIVMYGCVEHCDDREAEVARAPCLRRGDVLKEPCEGVLTATIGTLDLNAVANEQLRRAALAFVRWRPEDLASTMDDTHTMLFPYFVGITANKFVSMAIRAGAFGTWDDASQTCTVNVGTPVPTYHNPHLPSPRVVVEQHFCGLWPLRL
jgi:hypothetical protein